MYGAETAHFEVAVLAESTERALNLIRDRYGACHIRVKSMTGSLDFPVVGHPAWTAEGLSHEAALAA